MIALQAGGALAQIPAFPGAEGFAAHAAGGRGGDVYHVTNTNASGAGSFAYGLTTGVPAAGRTIVFDISGYTTISSTLRVTANRITVAGQTAPGDGFGLKNETFRVSGNNNVFRFIRFRDGRAGDAIDIDSTATNTLFDHCDAMFAHDENFSSFNTPPDNLTFQWSNNAWGLASHSAGGLWDVNRATVHHSLWAHNHTRNPKARPDGLLDWVNNVTFDWDIGFILGDSQTPANWKTNVAGSYFIASSSSGSPFASASRDTNGNPNFSVYVSGNLYDSDKDGLPDGTDRGSSLLGSSLANVNLLAAPVPRTAGIPVTEDADALLAYKKIVSACGPLRLDANPNRTLRDELNTILTNNLVTQRRHRITYGSLGGSGATNGGFGTLISSPAPADTDQDGMPDYWEKAVGYNPATANNNALMPAAGGFLTGTTYFPPSTPAGYTQLEEYLHYKAIPHRAVLKNGTLDIDLSRYTQGFTNNPVFTVSNVTGGTVALSGPGNSLAHFIPPADATGRAMFDFTVTDAEGSSWTQRFAILVSGDPLPADPVSSPLVWKGNGSSHTWNNVSSNQVWLEGTTPGSWGDTDTATFDDTGLNTPAITVSGTVQPSAVTVDASKNYTFTGTGGIGGASSLTKTGPGTLTFSNTGTNTFPLDILFDGGTVVIGPGSTLGNGPLEFRNGVLTSLYTSGHTLPNLLTIPGGSNVLVNMSPQMKLGGTSGAGTLNLRVTAATVQNSRLNGSWSGFTGTLNLSATTGTPALICANFNGDSTNGSFNNLNAATVNLDNVNLGGRDNSGGNTLGIGALQGTGTAVLGGAHYAGALTYSIGALNRNTVFNGSITNSTSSTDSASGSATILTKTGTGTLTWNGNGSHTGATNLNAGTLILNGTFGRTATTVASGARLGGAGRIGDSAGGSVTAASGSALAPGAAGQAGLLRLAALTLNGTTLHYDLSGTPGGSNDRITTQNLLKISGTQNFLFTLTQGGLGAGTYSLIDGGNNTSLTSAGFTHNLPATTRQSFALASSANGATVPFVQLAVTGNAENLIWSGAAGPLWNLNSTANWSLAGSPATFYNLDAVTFDDTATEGTVTLTGSLQPREVMVSNQATAYSFGGTGSLAGSAALIKTGPGTLTINSANTYSRGTTINGGTVSISTSTGLGTGFAALNGTALHLATIGLTFANDLRLTGNSTLGLTGGNNTHTGLLTGTGNLAFHFPAGGLLTLQGNIDGFAGGMALTGTGGTLRFNPPTGGAWGSAVIAFEAGTGTINNRATSDTTIFLGSLSGAPPSQLRGSDQAGPAVDTYAIGALNTDTHFAGSISDGSHATPHITALTKTGTGTLGLSGSSQYSGDTAVHAGKLDVSGSLTSPGSLGVSNGATLQLTGGTVAMDQVVIGTGGFLRGCGTLIGDVINHGTVQADCGTTLTLTGDVVNHGTFRVTSGTRLALNGSFTNTGLLDLLTAEVSPAVLADIVNEGIVLDSSQVQVASASRINGFTITIQSYAGHSYRLQRSATLSQPDWTDLGPPQNGNGTVLTFNDPAAAAGASFYRIAVDP